MAYTLYFSDPTKYSSSLSIEDNKLNSDQTSLSFVGKNASGYAAAISTNFLHLLENFASGDEPNNPIEGQLWFDTSDTSNKKLRINDSTSAGANWKPINGIYQQSNTPEGAAQGDIWVDTGKAQLFLTLDGVNWTLVGPSYSATLKTGRYPEQITDTFGNTHSIIKNYIDDQVVEIITYDTFVPQQKIEGFETLKAGLNLSSANSSLLNATAYAAQNLLVTTPVRSFINGNSFVRNDIDNSINASLNVRSQLSLGLDPTFLIKKSGTLSNEFRNTTDGGNFKFYIIKDEIADTPILTLDGNYANGTQRIGINRANPQFELDVNGSVRFSGTLTITTSADDALVITGSARFGKAVVFDSPISSTTATFTKGITVGTSTDSTLIAPKAIITPATNGKYDLGTSALKYANVYAGAFNGNLVGSATAANSLTNAANFTITGDIESPGFTYQGLAGTKTFVTTATTSLISRQTRLESMSETDYMLISTGDARFFGKVAYGGRGSGLTVDISRTGSAYGFPTANPTGIVNSGTGYLSSDVLTVYGTDLGGVSPDNDVDLTITVNSAGSITAMTLVTNGSKGQKGPASGLRKVTRKDFLSEVNYQGSDLTGRPNPQGPGSLVPAGSMIPYAGLNAPPGWLFCDGAIVSKNDYPNLYVAIGYVYGYTSLPDQFALPDMRGRTAIGYDNMTNGLATSTGKANRVIPADTPVLSGAGTATVVASGFYYGTQDSSGTAGYGGTSTNAVLMNVMNPYLAINYIIKT